MITTVIFDLDGLLADTEPLHCRAYQDALQSEGASLTEADYIEHWVRSGKGIADWVALHGLNVDPLALRVKKSARYLELLERRHEVSLPRLNEPGPFRRRPAAPGKPRRIIRGIGVRTIPACEPRRR